MLQIWRRINFFEWYWSLWRIEKYAPGCNHLESFRWVLGSSIYCNCKAPTFNHLLLQAGRTLQSSSSTDTLPILQILPILPIIALFQYWQTPNTGTLQTLTHFQYWHTADIQHVSWPHWCTGVDIVSHWELTQPHAMATLSHSHTDIYVHCASNYDCKGRGIAVQPVIALIFSSCALDTVRCAPAMFCSRKRRDERHWQPSFKDFNIIQENSPFVQSEAWDGRNHRLVSNMFI